MEFQSFSSIIFTWTAFSLSCGPLWSGQRLVLAPYHQLPYSSVSESPRVTHPQTAAWGFRTLVRFSKPRVLRVASDPRLRHRANPQRPDLNLSVLAFVWVSDGAVQGAGSLEAAGSHPQDGILLLGLGLGLTHFSSLTKRERKRKRKYRMGKRRRGREKEILKKKKERGKEVKKS